MSIEHQLLVKKVDTGEELEALFLLRKEIYSRWGFLEGNDSDKAKDIDEYDLNSKSVHFVAYYKKEIVGTIRMIFADKVMLPIEKEYDLNENYNFGDRSEVVEISRMASNNHVAHHFKDQRIMIGLMKIVHDYGYAVNKKKWLAAIDEKIFHLFHKIGLFWEPLGPPKKYMGSPSVPAHFFLPTDMERCKKYNYPMWNELVNGRPDIKIVF